MVPHALVRIFVDRSLLPDLIRHNYFNLLVFLGVCLLPSNPVLAHGGVAFEEDVCLINIGFLQAHFTLYQPLTSGSEEFCEDIPEVSDSVFVLDYLHDFLREMPVDFRIIRDVTDIGVYASWDDILSLPDLEKVTEFYQSPVTVKEGVFKVSHPFSAQGSFIGIVTAQHPTEDKAYHAVFHFQVGGANYRTIPYFVVLILVLQLLYWISTGGLKRRVKKQRASR